MAACLLIALQMALLQLGSGGGSSLVSSFLHPFQEGLAVRPESQPRVLSSVVTLLAVAGAVFFWKNRPERAALVLSFVLLLHGSDLIRWRIQILHDETVPLEEALYAVQRVTPMPYLARRTASADETPRSRVFEREVFDAGATSGTMYDYVEPFLHRDPIWSRYFVTQWSAPVDRLMRAHAGQPLAPDGHPPPPLRDLRPGYARIAGQGADKLRVFSAAHPGGGDDEIAAVLNRPEFRGDVLLLSSPAPAAGRLDVAADERVAAVPNVLRFGADQVQVEVVVVAEAWLVYDDAWHPDWHATVNGVATPVERANLAYKAVRLQAGRNVVDFRFRNGLRTACGAAVAALSAFWCVVVMASALKLLGAGPARQDR